LIVFTEFQVKSFVVYNSCNSLVITQYLLLSKSYSPAPVPLVITASNLANFAVSEPVNSIKTLTLSGAVTDEPVLLITDSANLS
jgi:hypothetical protein